MRGNMTSFLLPEIPNFWWHLAGKGSQFLIVFTIKRNNYVFKNLSLWETVCKEILPCRLVALTPQIDLQAFIKAAAVVMQGRDSCMVICGCVCACVKSGSRLLPEVRFHSPLFHHSYKATAVLHSVQSCKNFFYIFPSLSHPPPFFSLPFHGHSRHGRQHWCKWISLHLGILEDLDSSFKQTKVPKSGKNVPE